MGPAYTEGVRLQTTVPVDIQARLSRLGEAVGRVPGVRFAYLFGSAAIGPVRPLSDIDIAVFVDDSFDPFEVKLAVMAAAAKHLATDRVDVVVLNSAPLSLAGRVLSSRIVIADRDPFARHRYESLVGREFADFRLYEQRHFARRQARG